jgi:GNAT superfamily N-acetyltransferase
MTNSPTESGPGDEIEVVPFRRDLAGAFASLNRAWIEEFFELEEADRKVLDHPEAAIVARGGQIFFALDGGRPVGTVAVITATAARFELAKMAVAPSHQGRGVGARLARVAIDFARAAGATTMFLETNSGLPAALHLYERLGFLRMAPPHPSPYARSNVYMELDISR